MEPPADDDATLLPAPPNPLPESADPSVPPAPTPQMQQLDEATAAQRDEVRRLVDAGASSPEDLRLLADKIRLQREREQQVWRAEVKPSLRKSKKRAFTLRDLKDDEPDTGRSDERRFLVVAGVSVLLVLLVLTLSSTPIVLILFLLVALGIYAYVIGRRSSDDLEPSDGVDPSDEPGSADGEPDA